MLLKQLNFLFLVLTSTHLVASLQFEIEKINPQEERIILKQDDQTIGFLFYRPELAKVVIIHSFYIKPEWRNNGYGSSLLAYTITHLKNKGYKTITLQAKPFELNDGLLMPINDDIQQEHLIHFYQKNDFKKTLLLKQNALYYGSLSPIIFHSSIVLTQGAITACCYLITALYLKKLVFPENDAH